MIVSNRPTTDELANTFAPFLSRERINHTALPQKRETKRDKFERKYGMLYTAGAVVTGIAIFCALKKGGKIFDFSKLSEYLKRYSASTTESFKKINEYPFLQKTKLKTALTFSKIGQIALNIGNFVGNLNPFKDIAFDRITKFLRIKPLFDKIQTLFTKFAKNLSFSKYQKASKNLSAFNDVLQEAIEFVKKTPTVTFKGKSISGQEFAERLSSNAKELLAQMQEISGKNFSGRFNRTVRTLNEHSEKEFLQAISGFKKYEGQSLVGKIYSKIKETGDFLPAKIMERRHKQLFESLFASKQKLSNNILDLYQTLSKSIDDIFDAKSISNDELRQSYLKLRDLLSKFKEPAKYGVKRGTVRQDLLDTLQDTLFKFEKQSNSIKKSHTLKSLVTLIQKDEKGLIEETVSSLKILKDTNPELYAKLLQNRNKFQKSLQEAVGFETDKTYRKLLDFSLHSLPTDFLTMGISAGCVGVVLANRKKSRQEKISINLEKGIPVLGGLIVSFLSNVRQVASGTGSIFLGVISAIVLNRIGRVLSNLYLKAQNKSSNQNKPEDLEKLKSVG